MWIDKKGGWIICRTEAKPADPTRVVSLDESLFCGIRASIMGLNVVLEGELIFFCLFLKLTGVFESDSAPAAIGNWRILDVVK